MIIIFVLVVSSIYLYYIENKVDEIIVKPSESETKRYYKKFEEIKLPSSLSPYISRDQICYKTNNTPSFTSKRGGCMACKVGSDPIYDGTNVVSTCVYTLDNNNTSDNIWTKQQCLIECSKE
jgi:hypothetical protein